MHMNPTGLIAALSSLNFIAVDVETANEQYDSLCALGIVVVKNGVVVEERSYRIRPRVLRVSIINQQIHKLTEEDLKDEPEIRDIWPDIQPLFVDQILAAHNASFDMEVLERSLRGYGIKFPRVKYLCSLKVVAKAFPGLPSYKLNDLAAHFEIDLDHHDAASDARACAAVIMRALPMIRLSALDLASDDLTCRLDIVASAEKKDPWIELFGKKDFDSRLLKPDLDVANKDNPFYNKRVVFTGDLDGMERAVAAQLIQALGADINTSISKRTNIVIVGRAPGPSKMKKIAMLQTEGHDIRLMHESEFLEIVEKKSGN
jgi:DNA polymerase-3 subunit epsilon